MLRKQNIDLVTATADILLGFATAFDHIPPTRRVRLFILLANSLGVKDSLYAIIASLVDRDSANEETYRFAASLLSKSLQGDALQVSRASTLE